MKFTPAPWKVENYSDNLWIKTVKRYVWPWDDDSLKKIKKLNEATILDEEKCTYEEISICLMEHHDEYFTQERFKGEFGTPEANAKLIAKAPEMFELLKCIKDGWVNGGYEETIHTHVCKILNEIEK